MLFTKLAGGRRPHRILRLHARPKDLRLWVTEDLPSRGAGVIYNHMVAYQLSDADLDRLFRALGDTTRRDIVARVMAGEPASISSLAARYDMSFAAVQKHVAVLEAAGLVTKERQGRERLVRGNPERLARARDLLVQLEDLWRVRFSQLDSLFSDQPGSRE